MLPSLSSAAAAAAAATTVIPPSTSSANHSSTTPTAHLLSSDGVQTHPIDLSTHSSSQSVIATPTSSINPVTPPTQLHASLVSCAECIILYSAFLSWCGCLPTATLPNPLNASTSIGVVNPTNAAVHPPTGTVTENTANGGSNANNENRNGVGPCTRSDEVGDGEAEVREEGGDEWRCEKCGKTYNSSTSLRKHKQSHLLRWKCHFCEKTFSRNWLLEGHERTHTGEKPFVCPTCQRAFADRSNMRAHMQTHLTVKRHRCPHCAQSFPRRSQLIRHMQTCLFSTAAALIHTFRVIQLLGIAVQPFHHCQQHVVVYVNEKHGLLPALLRGE
uniref:Zinc finger C2H2 type n=1 Tax=Echinococcus granulosus TaxID=6210 RepID=A0A068X2Q6_ECHGR|nr:zinc finger C2H2 type [Echinococcus granulosus]